jgi:hypothetical protein
LFHLQKTDHNKIVVIDTTGIFKYGPSNLIVGKIFSGSQIPETSRKFGQIVEKGLRGIFTAKPVQQNAFTTVFCTLLH